MGEAKRRGTFEERRALAIKEGRKKVVNKPFRQMGTFLRVSPNSRTFFNTKKAHVVAGMMVALSAFRR